MRFYSQVAKLSAALLALALASCGDNAHGGSDAGPAGPDELTALAPGPDIGLAFAGSVELRVLDTDFRHQPVADAEVRFSITVDPERPTDGPAGSILSAPAAITDQAGIARVTLTAGRQRTRFLVSASAEGALPTTFQVAVSEEGFAALDVRPRYTGVRAEADFARVRVHLYDDQTCGKLLAGAGPPPSFYPPRTVLHFGELVGYANLLPRMPYAVLARGEDSVGNTRAQGCVDLLGRELPPGRRIEVPVPARDRRITLEGELVLDSALELGAMSDAVAAADAPWRVLAGCASGPGQLLVDALLAELPAGAVRDALAARRGDLPAAMPGATACRGATAPAAVGGGPSLEARALVLMTETAGAAATRVSGLDVELAALVSRLELVSRLTAHPLGEGRTQAAHTLELARLRLGGATHEVVLAATARPMLAADEVAIELSLNSAGETATLAPHGFSLRWGQLVGSALGELSLGARMLPRSAKPLAVALVDEAGMGATRGCAALDAGLCTLAGQPAGCIAVACPAARVGLGVRLQGTFDALDGTGADLMLSGTVPLADDDGDGRADALGTPALPGLWTATVAPVVTPAVAVPGTFTSR